jgi:hypothetical protein
MNTSENLKSTISLSSDLVTKLAMYDPRKMFDKFGNPMEVPDLGRLSGMALAGFEIEELFDGKGEERKKIGYVRKVKLLDRTPYIMALGKYLNAFPVKPSGPTEPNRGTLPLADLTLGDRLQLRDVIAKFIEDKSAEKTIQVVNGNGHKGTNGHGA